MNDTSDLIPENETNWQNDWQIPYFDNLTEEQQKEITDSIRLLLRQTFVLERKYDKKTERLQYTAAYRTISKHFPFIRHYLAVAGIELTENSYLGIIYVQGEDLLGEKLPKLATLYLLALKLIYDEQMDCWHPSPAYDLTWSTTYFGEHSTTVDGNGRNPGMKELLAVGKAAGMNAKNCKKIVEEIWEKTRTLEATYRGWKS